MMGYLLKKSHSTSALREERMDWKKKAGRATDNYGMTEILRGVGGGEKRGK